MAAHKLPPKGFKDVCGISGGYTNGFDPKKTYMFWRDGWAGPRTFRMIDCDPAFNVAGLYYRDLP